MRSLQKSSHPEFNFLVVLSLCGGVPNHCRLVDSRFLPFPASGKALELRLQMPARKKASNTANLGFEANLWLAADSRSAAETAEGNLRNNMDAADWSGAIGTPRQGSPKGERGGANKCNAENVFWVPSDARWPHLHLQAKLSRKRCPASSRSWQGSSRITIYWNPPSAGISRDSAMRSDHSQKETPGPLDRKRPRKGSRGQRVQIATTGALRQIHFALMQREDLP